MTEAEWLAAVAPMPMLEFLRGKASDRKLRLFAVACSRRIATPLFTAPLDVAERVADGQASDTERSDARKDAQRAAQVKGTVPTPTTPKWERRGASSAYYATARDSWEAAWNAWQFAIDSLVRKAGGYGQCDVKAIQANELRPQAALLRDIFGNPFRPVSFYPSWRTAAVVALTEGIYTGKEFERMPLLADALEDAACPQEDILRHCRGAGPHVKGCWVVDLLTGRK